MVGGYIFLRQMVSIGNYEGVVSSHDKIFYTSAKPRTEQQHWKDKHEDLNI